MDHSRQVLLVATLLSLSCLVQVVLIRRATVPGLDAVRFVEIARRIDQQGLLQTARHEREPPLFPAWIRLVHGCLTRATGDFRSSWAVSAQLAAAIPLVLAVVPVYFLSIRLVGQAAALAGSVLFCLLPEVARLGADGISDSTHLLFFCLGLWAVVLYLGKSEPRQRRVQGSGFGVQEGSPPAGPCGEECVLRVAVRRFACLVNWSPLWLLAAGIAVGLAALVRVEALVLPLALVIALAVFQLRVARRQPWPQLAVALGCLAMGCGLVFGPYIATMRCSAPRTALQRILGRYEPEETEGQSGAVWQLPDGEAMAFAPKETTTSLRRRGYPAAATQFVEELAGAFGWLIGAFALFGVWRLRSIQVRPMDRFAQIYFLLFSLAVVHFTAKEGYLSARHLLTLVVIGIGCAGYGLLEAGQWIAGRKRPAPGAAAESEPRTRSGFFPSPAAWGAVLLAGAICLLEASEPLHSSRLGHRQAAEWLATKADTPGVVLDTRGWTGLYSGHPTFRYTEAQAAFARPKLTYVVVESRELAYRSRRSRTLRRLLDVGAEPVASFPRPAASRPGAQQVDVYRWNAERFLQWVAERRPGQPAKEDRHARTRPRLHPERI